MWISRGLGSQLRAIRTVTEYETLLSLAHGQLLELEAERLARPTPLLAREGVFETPYQDYRWTMAATPRRGAHDLFNQAGEPLTCDVTLTVERQGSSSASRGEPASSNIRLQAIWPSEGVLQ